MESSKILEIIDHKTLMELSNSSLLEEVSVIGNKQGWRVIAKYRHAEKYLSATRNKKIRIFKKLETAIFYLYGLGIEQIIVKPLDSNADTSKYSRPDVSEALKKMHSAAKSLSHK